jgi:D-alanyl-D-alanine carboxypeptidase (penicillin-binding protein 5/6)
VGYSVSRIKKMSSGFKFFLISFLVSFFGVFAINIFQENLESSFYAQISQPFQNISLIKIPEKPQKPDLEIQAKSAISVKIDESQNQKIIFRNNINQSLPIASLTKLMTAVIVLENQASYDFSQLVTISKEAVSQDENFGNLRIEEKLSVKDLFNIMLIESSNDAAWALAEVIGVEEFVKKMNQKAESLNLTNTYFVNPTGLDPAVLKEPNNCSSTRDLSKLAKYILRSQPIIFEVSLKGSYEAFDDSGQFRHLAVNRNEFLNLSSDLNIVGGKTGYTEEAGGCMVLILKDGEGKFFINVVLGTPTQKARLEEMKKIISYLSA